MRQLWRRARWVILGVVVVLVAGGAFYTQLREPIASFGSPDAGAAPRRRRPRIVDSRSGREFVAARGQLSSFEYACAQGWGYSALDNVVAADPTPPRPR